MRGFLRSPHIDEQIQSQAQYQAKMAEIAHGVAPLSQMVMRGVGRGRVAHQIEADGASVVLTDRGGAAHIIEFGSVNNPAYAPLRRGAIAAGLRFTVTPK